MRRKGGNWVVRLSVIFDGLSEVIEVKIEKGLDRKPEAYYGTDRSEVRHLEFTCTHNFSTGPFCPTYMGRGIK
jgi:hypothetical protein